MDKSRLSATALNHPDAQYSKTETMSKSDDAWPFEDAPNLACFTVRSIMNGSAPILYVSHDEDDGAWQMLTSDAADMSQAMLVALAELVERDRTLVELADMPLGWTASRVDASSPWMRREPVIRPSKEAVVYFELDDGEALHEEAPETFYIAPREQRANLQPGQLAKLVFRIEHDETVDVERMWVIVEQVTATGYIGSLNNQPVSTDELQVGALVPFGPEHIIQIYDDE